MKGIIPRDNKVPYTFEYNKLLERGKYAPKPTARYKMLTGTYPHRTNNMKSGEYSNMYSKERYNFFLDAPFEISSKCCNIMKKSPMHKYSHETGRKCITAQMASESRLRTQQWLRNGCNGFDMKSPISNPMSFWTEQDVLLYIYEHKLPIASVYGDVVIDFNKMNQVDGQMSFSDYGIFNNERPIFKTTGCKRTGCMFCGFGCHMRNDERFVRMSKTHPQLYDYCMNKLTNNGITYKEAIDWTNEHGNLNVKY